MITLNIIFTFILLKKEVISTIEYIGLYKRKAIKAIGKVDKVIVTEINESSLSLKTVYPVGTELSIDE